MSEIVSEIMSSNIDIKCEDCIYYNKKNSFMGMCTKTPKFVKKNNSCELFIAKIHEVKITIKDDEKYSKIIIKNGKKEYIK